MTKTSSEPRYVYKLVPSSSPVPINCDDIPDRLPVSDLDKNSGFIHLSTSVQIPGTLKLFFKDDSLVYVLRIRYSDIEKKIRWEDPKAEVCGPQGGEGVFPHLYNGLQLGKNEIDGVEILEKMDSDWDTAIAKANEEWLVW